MSAHPRSAQPELTLRAIIVGCLAGIPVAAVNINMGLKTGFGEGGSILSLVLSMVIMLVIGGIFPMIRPFTKLENNLAQATATAFGSNSSALITVIPALMLLTPGWQPTFIMLVCYLVSTGMLGILFAVPLRKQYIEVEQLLFPSGTAGAMLLDSFYSQHGSEAKRLQTLLLSGFTALAAFVQFIAEAGYYTFTAVFTGGTIPLSMVGSPMLMGGGFLIGLRVSLSILAGVIFTFVIMPDFLLAWGYLQANSEGILGARTVAQWTMWPGVALVVSAGLTALALRWRTIVTVFTTKMDTDKEMPMKEFFALFFGASCFTAAVMWYFFNIHPLVTFALIGFSFVLSIICARALGETEFNPVGASTTIAQVLSGILSPGSAMTNLGGGGITSTAASQAGEVMQDLKTGHLVGATPRYLVAVQFIGVLMGAVVSVGLFFIFTYGQQIGSDALPAPGAMSKLAVAKTMLEGSSGFPSSVLPWMLGAALIGALLAWLEKSDYREYVPSSVGLGVGLILPVPVYGTTIAAGAILGFVLSKVFKSLGGNNSYVVGASLLVGETLVATGFAIYHMLAG